MKDEIVIPEKGASEYVQDIMKDPFLCECSEDELLQLALSRSVSDDFLRQRSEDELLQLALSRSVSDTSTSCDSYSLEEEKMIKRALGESLLWNDKPEIDETREAEPWEFWEKN